MKNVIKILENKKYALNMKNVIGIQKNIIKI